MRIRYAYVAIAALMAASAIPAFAQSAADPSTATAPTCDNSIISGAYAAHGSGWTGSAAPFSPEAVISLRNFDGNGKFTGHGVQTLAGTPHNFTITGTYKVLSDCTLDISGKSVPSPTGATIHWYGIVTNNGNVIHVIRDDPGATTSTDFNRITPVT